MLFQFFAHGTVSLAHRFSIPAPAFQGRLFSTPAILVHLPRWNMMAHTYLTWQRNASTDFYSVVLQVSIAITDAQLLQTRW